MKPFGQTELVFLSAKRTPFGTLNGSLKDLSATDLGVLAAKAALEQSHVKPEEIDHVIMGNVVQTSADAIYLARHIGLKSGIPERVPALVVSRLCGSGFQAVASGAEQILTGQAQCVLVGGTESMTQAPHVVRGARNGLPFGKQVIFEDSLWSSLTDSYTGLPMAITAETLATQYGLTQAQVDEFAVTSQKRAAAAWEAGRFNDEVVPVELKGKKGSTFFSKDEHLRPDTTLESLQKLPKVFKKDGVIHAGAASGICDGAAAMVLASAEFARQRGLQPLGRLLGWGVAGCDPKIMGIGPVPAIRAALERTQSTLAEIDLFEVNEAFAPQYLAVEKELGLPREKTNVDGGAIAIGHPLGASGARITAHLLYALKQRQGRYAVGSACIGGGMGMAVVLESL